MKLPNQIIKKWSLKNDHNTTFKPTIKHVQVPFMCWHLHIISDKERDHTKIRKGDKSGNLSVLDNNIYPASKTSSHMKPDSQQTDDRTAGLLTHDWKQHTFTKKLNIYRFIIDIFQNKQNISVSASERRSSGKEALFALLTPLPRISETTPLKKH